jgi:hypothetical protein
MQTQCPSCGSTRLLSTTPVTKLNVFGLMQLRIGTRSAASLEHPSGPARLSARVCVDCGCTSLWAKDLADLRAAYDRGASAGRLGLDDPE